MKQENKYLRSLVQNAQEGKIVALVELYKLNLNKVYTVIRRLTGNKSLAELVTKNTLVTGWKSITEDGPGEISFTKWFEDIAVITAINELQNLSLSKNKKKQKLLEKEPHNWDYSSNPMEKIIAELNLENRIAFVLYKVENYNLSEISNFIGISKSEAEIKLSESIEKISRAMSEAQPDLELSEHWQNLQELIEPDENILKSALEEIKGIKTEEIKEEEIATEGNKEIEQIENAIEKERKAKAKAERARKKWGEILPSINISKKVILGATISLLIVYLLIQITTSSHNWSVSILSGTPLINDKPVENTTVLAVDDVISTDGLSTALIEIPEVGKIEILNSTTFKRLDEDFSGELIKGKSIVQSDSTTVGLSILIPKAKIENFSTRTNYSVLIDERGNSVIEPSKGWLRVLSGDYELILPKEYRLNVYKEFGVSVPHHSESNFEFITRLEEYLFGGKRNTTFNFLLSLSTNRESVTLWNLLRRVNPEQREAVYNKLYELIPHSDSILKEYILILKSDELLLWLGEIRKLL
jgi:DNA-directed RNA polymerase specialized sigma24 family protein